MTSLTAPTAEVDFRPIPDMVGSRSQLKTLARRFDKHATPDLSFGMLATHRTGTPLARYMENLSSNTDQSLPGPVTKALESVAVAELLTSVGTRTAISYAESEELTWASATGPNGTTIWQRPCKRPAEALAHELLHAELKLDGYRQYLTSAAKAPCAQPGVVPVLLKILDNELQHHRMLRRFQELGFDGKFFYEDGDINAFKKVRRTLEKMDPSRPTVEFFTQFATIISPGGAPSEADRTQVKNYFRVRAGDTIAKRMDEVERIVAEWRDSKSLDAGPYIRAILRLMALKCSYWVGASERFPEDGFFTGEPFEAYEAQPV